MSEQTKIEWADATWNPWIGCTKVSPGCAHCYAEMTTLARRKRSHGVELWGRGAQRHRTSEAYWKKPHIWNRAPRLAPGTPRPRIFPSLCDWLDDEVPIEWLADFLQLIHETPDLDWLLLTKRPENWRRRINAVADGDATKGTDEEWADGFETRELARRMVENDHELPNVWIGTSVEDQERADERIPALLKIPARVRFLSVEPMLGAVDLNAVPWKHGGMAAKGWSGVLPVKSEPDDYVYWEQKCALQWVIVGGESGPKARPCNVAWVRDIVRQCKAASVPCFVKQLGAFCIEEEGSQRRRILFDHPKGGDPHEWPDDLRVREFPEVGR